MSLFSRYFSRSQIAKTLAPRLLCFHIPLVSYYSVRIQCNGYSLATLNSLVWTSRNESVYTRLKSSIPFRQVSWRHTAIGFLSFITLSNKSVFVIVSSPCTQYSSWYFFFRITILSPLFARHRGTVEIQSPILQWVENCEACKTHSPLEWSTPSSFVSSSSCSSSTLVALGVVAHLFCMRDFRSPPHL